MASHGFRVQVQTLGIEGVGAEVGLRVQDDGGLVQRLGLSLTLCLSCRPIARFVKRASAFANVGWSPQDQMTRSLAAGYLQLLRAQQLDF